MKRNATAVWNGTIKEGSGKISTQSNVLKDKPYSFKTRFENEQGTNPDELLAASHAGCFAMALSNILGENGFTPKSLETTASVTMNTGKLELLESHLKLKARIPGIDKEKFLEFANAAKNNCPISKALSVPIKLDAELL